MAGGRFLAILLSASTVSALAGEPPPPSCGEWVWWEAESPKASSFPERNPFGPWDEKGAVVLSGGKWIGASDPGKVLFLEYQVEVPRDGTYGFYCRKFWQHG